MSKGGGSQTTTQEIDPDMKAAYLANLGYAGNTASALGERQFAGFNPQYQAGEQQIQTAAQNGVGMQNLDAAANMSRAAANYNAPQFGGQSAGPAAMANSSTYNTALSNAAQANTGDMGRYFNPFQTQVIDATMQDLERGRQAATQNIGERATAAKAFGGSRHGVAEALSNSQFGDQAGKTISQLRSQGFDAASNMMQQDLARKQQTALTNQAALNQGGQFGAGAMNQAALANQSAQNQMNQYNAGNFQQAGLANQQADLQGAQFRLNAANQLGSMGQQQTAGQYAGGQALMGLGANRQGMAQQQMDATRNLNQERLNIMQGAVGLQPGNLGGSTTSPTYQNTGASMMGGAMMGNMLFPGMGGIMGGALMGLV